MDDVLPAANGRPKRPLGKFPKTTNLDDSAEARALRREIATEVLAELVEEAGLSSSPEERVTAQEVMELLLDRLGIRGRGAAR